MFFYFKLPIIALESPTLAHNSFLPVSITDTIVDPEKFTSKLRRLMSKLVFKKPSDTIANFFCLSLLSKKD
jgi:hypothetical protein